MTSARDAFLQRVRQAVTEGNRAGHAPAPLFVKICLTDQLAWGMPPSARAIDAYLSVIPPDVPHIWMVYTSGQSHWPINLHAIAAGGHVRTGLGDNPVEPDGVRPTSAEQVARVPMGQRATRFLAAGGDLVLTVHPETLPAMYAAVLTRARDHAASRATAPSRA